MHQQRWRIYGKLNIQLSETWLLKLHKQECKKYAYNSWSKYFVSNNKNSSYFKLYECRYAFQLIKLSIFNYYFTKVDMHVYTLSISSLLWKNEYKFLFTKTLF